MEINKYENLNISEKIYFLENEFPNIVLSISQSDLNAFLKEIILNISENSYIRLKALDIFIDSALMECLKARHVLNMLIDSWPNSFNLDIEILRLKGLYIFYHEDEKEIEGILETSSHSIDTEIVSEACYRLGLIKSKR